MIYGTLWDTYHELFLKKYIHIFFLKTNKYLLNILIKFKKSITF